MVNSILSLFLFLCFLFGAQLAANVPEGEFKKWDCGVVNIQQKLMPIPNIWADHKIDINNSLI
jgi:hypothetical protein